MRDDLVDIANDSQIIDMEEIKLTTYQLTCPVPKTTEGNLKDEK